MVDAFHPLHLLGADRGHAVLVLQHAVDDQERLLDDDEAIAREEIGADDDVGDAGFVLEREEDEALRGAGALARDDHAGHADAAALPRGAQIGRAQDAAHRQLVAPQRHRMAADGQPRAGVVGDEPLGLGHRLQRTLGLIDRKKPRRPQSSQRVRFQKRSQRSLRALRFLLP